MKILSRASLYEKVSGMTTAWTLLALVLLIALALVGWIFCKATDVFQTIFQILDRFHDSISALDKKVTGYERTSDEAEDENRN